VENKTNKLVYSGKFLQFMTGLIIIVEDFYVGSIIFRIPYIEMLIKAY